MVSLPRNRNALTARKLTPLSRGLPSDSELRCMKFRVQLGLALNLIVFATLLNSVGIVIERSIAEWAVSKTVGGTLEGCKDLTIALTSLLFASQVPRIGYRRTMLGGLAVVTLVTALVGAVQAFWTIPLLFVLCGASFALVKVSVYSTVGLIANDHTEHTALINRMEGVYQLGAMASPLVFAYMIANSRWTNFYYVISALSAISFCVWLGTPLDESAASGEGKKTGLAEVFSLMRMPMVLVFLVCAWIYVMVEQSISTWLPTFNRDVFGLSASIGSALLAVYFGSLAISRLIFGALCRRFSSFVLQEVYLAVAFCLTLTVLLKTHEGTPPAITSWANVPPLVVAFCLVGFFIGPIYPTLNSMVLQRLAKPLHSSMTGLIIIFSALGGTSGSQLLGYLSQHYSTHEAFHFPLIPIALLAVLLFAFRALCNRADVAAKAS
jgi:FHS family glucose/mannose:H+ symporter-like MFS transporter